MIITIITPTVRNSGGSYNKVHFMDYLDLFYKVYTIFRVPDPTVSRTWVTVAFWTSLSYASLSATYALYQVSVRQATISLSLLLAHTSQRKPWESLWGSSATTPLVDFHHRLTACPSYIKKCMVFCFHAL